MKISFTVPGSPFGKQRPRHMKNGHTYTPSETREHEQLFAAAYRQQCKGYRFPPGENIDLQVIAYMKIPKSASKSKREKMLAGELRPTVKPDWDNIGKLAADALNGIAYDDDKCIVDATVRKFYAIEPRTVVTIQEAR